MINQYIISNDYNDNINSIRLNLNEYDFEHPKSFYENLINSINIKTNITHYTNNEYTKKLLEKLSILNNIDINNILLTSGSDNALNYIIDRYINNDTNVLILKPSYDYFETIVSHKNCNIFSIPIRLDDNNIPLSIDYHFNAYENELNNNSLVYIVNPNNPFGVLHNINEIEILIAKYVNAIFIIDEAYIDFSENGNSSIEFIKKYNNVIITRTFSKAYGLAGMRLGYLATNYNNINYIKSMYNEKNVVDLTKQCGIFVLNNLNHYNLIINNIKENRKDLELFFKKNNIYFIPSFANFVTFYIGSNLNKFIEILKDNNIYIRIKPNSVNMKGFARISIGNDKNMKYVKDIILNNIDLIEPYLKCNNYFIDGCFDGYHYGHVNAFLQSKKKCDILIAGTHCDEELKNIKGDTLFNDTERLFMLKHCKYIDTVIDDYVPYITNIKTLDKYNCINFLHGEENITTINNEDPLYYIKKSNRYTTYEVTKGISTTQLLKRLYQYINNKEIEYNNDTVYLTNIFNETKKYFNNNNFSEQIIIYDSWDLLCSIHVKYLMELKQNNNNLKIIACVCSSNNNCIYSQLERAIIISSIKEIDEVILEENLNECVFSEANANNFNYLNIIFDKNKYIEELIVKINMSKTLKLKLEKN